MPKQVKQSNRPQDVNQLAHYLVEVSTREPEGELSSVRIPPAGVSQYMAEIGRKGGKIGGKRRLKTMTKEQRKKVARKAAKARWKKAKTR